MPTSYYTRDINSDLTGGADFNKKYLETTGTGAIVGASIAAGATEISYVFSEPGVPGNVAWPVGDWQQKVPLGGASGVGLFLNLRVGRVNSAGVLQGSEVASTEQAAVPSTTMTFNWTSVDLGTAVVGDRIRLAFVGRNPTAGVLILRVNMNTSDNELQSPVPQGVSGTCAGSTLAAVCSAAASVVITATCAATVQAATCAATAAQIFSASAAAVTSPAVASATAEERIEATAATSTAAATAAATADQLVTATAAAVAQAAQAAATAGEVFTATAAAATAPATASAMGESFSGAAAAFTSPATAAATAEVRFNATADCQASAATCAAAASVGDVVATAAVVAPSAIASAAGTEVFGATASVVAPSATAAATGTSGNVATVACSTAPATCAAAGSMLITGTAACVAPSATCAAAGGELVLVTATAAAVAPAATASALAIVSVSAAETVAPLALPAALAPFLIHNWLTPVENESAWQTDVTEAETVAEDRCGLVTRPTRMVEARLTGINASDALKMEMAIKRLAQNRGPAPLYSDHSRVLAASSGVNVWCSTSYRRFFVGQRVAVVAFTSNRVGAVNYRQILAVFADRLIVTSALSQTFPIASRVYPLIDAEVALTISGNLTTDLVVDVDLRFFEVAGPSALPPIAATPPPSYPTHADGRPILIGRVDWGEPIRNGVVRSGQLATVGKADIAVVRGERAQSIHGLNFRCNSRVQFWDVLRFWDWAQGRNRSFWVIDPGTLFALVALTTTYVDVVPAGNLVDAQAYLQNVAAVERDGTVNIRAVQSIAVNAGNWRITFATSMPAVASTLRRVTAARLCRSDSDAMRETWTTDEFVECTIPVRELLQEKVVALSLLDYVPVWNPVVNLPSLVLWVDAVSGIRKGTSTGDDDGPADIPLLSLVGDPITAWYDVRGAPAVSSFKLVGHHVPSSILAPQIARMSSPIINGDRPFALHDSGSGAGERFYLRPAGLQFFSNTLGLTIFFCGRMPPASPNGFIIRRRGVLVWSVTGVDAYETFNSLTGLQSFTYPDLGQAVEPFVLSLRWKPGGKVEVRKNGVLVAQSAGNITDLPTAFSLADELAAAETTRVADFDKVGADAAWTNSILLYAENLEGNATTDDLNRIGRELLRLCNSKTLWVPVIT